MCQERADLILMFSRCLNCLIVRAWGGRDPKPIELIKNGGPYAAPRDLIINLGLKTRFPQRSRWKWHCWMNLAAAQIGWEVDCRMTVETGPLVNKWLVSVSIGALADIVEDVGLVSSRVQQALNKSVRNWFGYYYLVWIVVESSSVHQRVHDQRCCKQLVSEWRLLASVSGVKVLA